MKILLNLLEPNDFNFPFLSNRVTANDFQTPLQFHQKSFTSPASMDSTLYLGNVVEMFLPISNELSVCKGHYYLTCKLLNTFLPISNEDCIYE